MNTLPSFFNSYVYSNDNDKQQLLELLPEQLEQILHQYRNELKIESRTLYECDHNLIDRLVDLIRLIYSSDQNKMNDLDVLVEEIWNLQDSQSVKQKQKILPIQNENKFSMR